MKRVPWLPIALALGCGSSAPTFPVARFANAPPVEVVDDRRDVPQPPHKHIPLEGEYSYRVLFERKLIRGLSLPPPQRARGVNSVDNAPDSTWFTNRGDLSLAQMRTGPITIDTPERHLPWTIQSTKFGGASQGFIITDARGVKFVLKFDTPAFPEAETGTEVVVDRLLWALGYNVPEDQIVYFHPDQLLLARDAHREDKLGHPRGRLTRVDVAVDLAAVAHEPDGRIRAMASRWIEGKALGGSLGSGTRKDDPNDRIPHELRRDLRGMYAIYAWMDMVDVWPGNFLDTWVSDPADPDRHYVKHYALDFGSSLGMMAMKNKDPRRGHAYRLDWPDLFRSLFTFGLWSFRWETRPLVSIPGVATTFTSSDFHPADWHADLPYLPFETKDRFDGFWGAKQVGRLTRDQIHAAVEAGRYSDPRSVEYITDTLVVRQRQTLAYWYDRVNPLDNFTTTADGRLCFEDLAIAHGLGVRASETEYLITPFDFQGTRVGASAGYLATPSGHLCVPLALATTSRNGYTVLELGTMRSRFHGTTYVHVARGSDGVARVIGLWRS